GATIRTGARVERILVKGGRAEGVVLEGGEELRARRVVSNADANVTLLRLAGAEHLPPEVADRVRAVDYASASLKINVALSELPDFTALPGTAPGPHHRGTIHVAPSLEYLEAAFDDARRGEPSRGPILECTIASVVDPTVAPPGKHVLSMFVQYAPYRLAGGRSWDEEKERFADRCFDALEAYAPNFRRAVIAREVLSPLDLERRFGLTGGNIFQGAMSANQLLFMRPIPGYARYRTPIRDLWMCGAATHPGGGVMGTCGWLAAREILRERRPGQDLSR
ncbi:MAG TPA: NAD(P)/FAD-dependent oxidoreductase, partial [Anaeromyxobacteraceae bacterium]|nr:NAD(P)/FAD-dependent oxidoreductase [Anaeromyxobacteraceae bacterium]